MLLFEDSIFVFVGLVVLLFFGLNGLGQLNHDLYFFVPMLYLFFLSSVLIIDIDEKIVSLLDLQYYFLLILFFLGFLLHWLFFILLSFQRNYWLFVERDVLELNSFILLIQIYWRIIFLFASKRRWWISRPLFFNGILICQYELVWYYDTCSCFDIK